jgi:hypothetical protein
MERAPKGKEVGRLDLLYESLTLDRTKREIRLVILSSGPITAPIECQLTIASLRDDYLEYEALSYCWGDLSDPETINLQGQPFKVGKNLYRAFIRLREPDEARTLWIDAVCIDQNNMGERAQQVELMGEIYSRTKNCNIWLGEFFENFLNNSYANEHRILRYTKGFPVEDLAKDERVVFRGDQSDIAIAKDFTDRYCTSFIQSMVKKFTCSKIRYWAYLGAFCWLSSIANNQHLSDFPFNTHLLGKEVIFPSVLEALSNILEAPWWRRIWTVQEAVLPHTTTAILGSISMPFNTVLKACDLIRYHILECCSGWVKKRSIHELCLIQSDAFLRTGYLSEVKKEYLSPGSSRIRGKTYSKLMTLFRSRLATNPSDKVYGLLGLFSDEWKNTDLLKPDYTLSPGKVYARATFRIFQLEKSLDFLFYCDGYSPADFITAESFAKGISSTEDSTLLSLWQAFKTHLKKASLSSAEELSLPSWVPHWTALGGDSVTAMGFNTSYGFYEPPQLLDDIHLSVVSQKMDKIVSIFEDIDGIQMSASLRSICQMINFDRAQELLYPNGSSVEDAFLRTLMEDNWMFTGNVIDSDYSFLTTGKGYQRATEEDVVRMKAMLQGVLSTGLDTEGNDVDAKTWQRIQDKTPEVFKALKRKTFFVTETGYIGFGRGDVQKNDEVHIIVGANYPFVLRQVPAGISGAETTSYKMVGNCYLHGIMYGEAMQSYKQGHGGSRRITLV